jgi:hypothetical protein
MALVSWGDRWCLGGGSAWAVPGPVACVPWWPVLVACGLGDVLGLINGLGGGDRCGDRCLIGGVWPALVVCPGA